MRRALLLAVFAVALWASPAAPAAGWCGSGQAAADRLPDAAAGPQVHALYVSPSDAPDRFELFKDAIADDADQIAAWWRSQDFTRQPRFDRFAFPGCPDGGALDITGVRLAAPAGTFASEDSRFNALRSALQAAGFAVDGKTYLVYYDGPLDNGGLCGQGTFRYAVTYLQACVSYTARAPVVAHELLHALGAVANGAPNRCPDSAHVCDSADIMNPTIAAFRPLSEFGLDIGHDDYYAHSGTWFDVQDSVFLQHLNEPTYPLTISFSGGTAAVKSDVPGVDCTAACTSTWDNRSEVSLELTPPEGRRLVRWTGACSGSGSCDVVMDGAKSVTAVLGPATVRVRVSVVGKGRVVGDTPCAKGTCTRAVDGGSAVFLDAKPAKGWKFVGWGGACKGRRGCNFTTDADVAVSARFVAVKKPTKKTVRA